MIDLLITGGLLGIIGQGIRVLVGLKKLRDASNVIPSANFSDMFDGQKLAISIFIGFVAGSLGALTMEGVYGNIEEGAFTIIGIGYMGVDFIEGIFLSRVSHNIQNLTKENSSSENSEITQEQVIRQDNSVENEEFINYTKRDKYLSGPNNQVQLVRNSYIPIESAFTLISDVGENATNNPNDITALTAKFKSLGFMPRVNEKGVNGLVEVINLFQSIIFGRSVVSGDGLISVPGSRRSSYSWLQAENCPYWTRLGHGSLSDRSIGFYNTTKAENDDFCTNWLARTIKEAGRIYYDEYLKTNPNSSVIYINDMSEERGVPEEPNQDLWDHHGHQTGLQVDVLLPRKDGASGGVNISESIDNYDQDAARAIISAFRKTKIGVKKVFFNDRKLVDEGLCKPLRGHYNHIHMQINVPDRITSRVDYV